jgi:hypothetical protein
VPLFIDDETPVVVNDSLAFRERLRSGRIVPVISNRAIFDQMLGGYDPFLASYSRYVGYPDKLAQPTSLTVPVKYYKHKPRDKPLTNQQLKFDYLNYVKNHFYRLAKAKGLDASVLDEAAAQIDDVSATEFAHLLGIPSFSGPDDPLLLLANLDFKIVLTTSPFTFIEDAFRAAGKSPQTEVCRWTTELKDSIPTVIDENFTLNVKQPLVYHLLGLDCYLDSIVLTEDDYLDYLGNISQGQGNESADFIPALVRKSFSDDLIVLGFKLDSWAFRVFYAGLIKRSGKPEDRGWVGIQMPDTDEERSYLEDYLQREAKFQVFWGTLTEYAQKELRDK